MFAPIVINAYYLYALRIHKEFILANVHTLVQFVIIFSEMYQVNENMNSFIRMNGLILVQSVTKCLSKLMV